MLKLYIRAAALLTDRTLVARRGDRGATAVEYALIIAGVAAVLAVVVFALQEVLTGLFAETCTDIINGNDAIDTEAPEDCTPAGG